MAIVPSVFLAFGANVGDREANIIAARRGLEARGFRITAPSSL
jgi:7,8-dihydro-6-hydroxymethylpterin-pyrophosphokinase